MPSPYLLTTVEKVLDWLKITDTAIRNTETTVLLSIIRQKSNVINTFLNRKIRLQEFTEFYQGDNTNSLSLRNFPVTAISTLHINSDIPRVFDSDALIANTEYDVDARLGILFTNGRLTSSSFVNFASSRGVSNNNFFGFGGTFPNILDSIKVVYSAGFNDFLIGSGDNDTIEWDNGTAQLATLTAAKYTGTSLASHIQTQMNAQIIGSDPYTVAYSNQTAKFKFSSTESVFVLQLFNGTLPDQTVGNTIGFDESVTGSGQSPMEWGTWTPNNGVIVADAVTTITPASKTGRIKIFNQGADNDLLYSVDGGTNFFNIPPFFKPNDILSQATVIKLKCKAGLTTTFFVAFTTEDGGSGTFISDIPMIGIPDDIEDACIRLSALGYEQSNRGSLGDLGLKSAGALAGGSETYDKDEQKNILKSISSYKRRLV